MDRLTCRQRACVSRAHRAHFLLQDENIVGQEIVYKLQERRCAGVCATVVLNVAEATLTCSCPKTHVWCEHCCYILLYELPTGRGTVGADMIQARRLPPAMCTAVMDWVHSQVMHRVMHPVLAHEQREPGEQGMPWVYNAGNGTSAVMCEMMRWAPRPCRARAGPLLWSDAQSANVERADRHGIRGGMATFALSLGVLTYTYRELRRKVIVTRVHLSSGVIACECWQSFTAPDLWCVHCCLVAAMHVHAPSQLHATILKRRLSTEAAYAIYVGHGYLDTGRRLLMRATQLVGSDCPICLCDAPEHDSSMCSGCRIGYHRECILKWMRTDVTCVACPTCRKPLDGWPTW